jgi:carbonic anhydrase/acetyltransferase-like protein (isoleucine patch superfamily)
MCSYGPSVAVGNGVSVGGADVGVNVFVGIWTRSVAAAVGEAVSVIVGLAVSLGIRASTLGVIPPLGTAHPADKTAATITNPARIV